MWEKLKAFFAHSETILLARVQMFAGIVFGAFLALDPSLFQAYVPAEYVPLYLLAIGILTEYARRRRADLGKDQ
ncbi:MULTISPECIES: hypothetical protein [unclassified Mesorhizobium]|uniref:hypothetical protein n=1 Tax=unclassified Mesorhizobium TaxID=325217 RepID=UPI00112B5E19|nr:MULTISPECIES: hypothetical protein [unclassified Mesorhizobium]TPJ38197.1 hypothetical protein FJ437_30960 [Mesorhizobium sp. B2-6-6]MCA0000971.1 hypothetical protein [Mesorhizobium sp. B264B2A]MCA0004720.1 hypothetical protein [Mesorhizobium sp. B264B1B]MCA0019081.1 hypothetical protein [Mesorhizobium sp. B264B1A]TPJ52553.1 hypothetical protein FJ462_33350 [Mesorhizobium sp. B2-6-7]